MIEWYWLCVCVRVQLKEHHTHIYNHRISDTDTYKNWKSFDARPWIMHIYIYIPLSLSRFVFLHFANSCAAPPNVGEKLLPRSKYFVSMWLVLCTRPQLRKFSVHHASSCEEILLDVSNLQAVLFVDACLGCTKPRGHKALTKPVNVPPPNTWIWKEHAGPRPSTIINHPKFHLQCPGLPS